MSSTKVPLKYKLMILEPKEEFVLPRHVGDIRKHDRNLLVLIERLLRHNFYGSQLHTCAPSWL